MSRWHKFEIRQYDLVREKSELDLRALFKNAHRWSRANASGKWKMVSLKPRGPRRTGIRAFLRYKPISGDSIIISFKKERDALLFKMFFPEFKDGDHYHYVDVILPVIRRAATNQLVSEILSVQPMTGKAGAIYALKARHEKSVSPSQRRAERRRLREKGVFFFPSQQVRKATGRKRPKQPLMPSQKTIKRIMKNAPESSKIMMKMIENTHKAVARGR